MHPPALLCPLLARVEARTLVVVLLVLGALWGFGALASEVMEGDTDAFDRMDQQNDDTSQHLILAHELGHVLGLDHVDDVDELMNPEYVGQTGFGTGDRQGLEELHDLPC